MVPSPLSLIRYSERINKVGAGIVLGLATQDKAKSIKGMRMIMDKFNQRNGATQCKLLKGVGTGKVLRECPLCVADASEFLEEILEKENNPKCITNIKF